MPHECCHNVALAVSGMNHPLERDLDHILEHTQGLWDELRGGRVFFTGGTGFFGCWLLESFVWANQKLGLDASAVVLTRNVAAFHKRAPYLASHAFIQCIQGDVRSFDFPREPFSHILHGAAETPEKINDTKPLLKFDTMVEGTRHVLDFARQCGAQKFLFMSSGAVYGKQPSGLTRIPESYPGSPDPADPRFVNGEAKRAAEMLCVLYARQYGLTPKIARCFAFVGPYLPLDFPYAIGNFIRDGLNGQPIRIEGDGTPQRSYLYAADLAVWLWTILFRAPPCRPYNVGSEEAITIGELAGIVAQTVRPQVEVLTLAKPAPDKPVDRYVPSTERARTELGLRQTTDLSQAIRRTVDWYAAGSSAAMLKES
jgi:nucleoside-diphosphate-sugar epimerase